MIKLNSVDVGYWASSEPVLANLKLEASPGEFICLLGRNGAGKSTLLRTLAGLQKPLNGNVYIQDENVHTMMPAERARKIAVVLTEREFGYGLTTNDVVAMGRHPHTGWRGKLIDRDYELINQAITQVEATKLGGRYLNDLSDGEKQRIMIARAIAQQPNVMLLDEITAFLDLSGRVASMSLLKEYAASTNATVVLSSHDLDLSLQLADTIWLLNGKGECISATPQALLDSGAINNVFDTDKVKYSSAENRFKLIV